MNETSETGHKHFISAAKLVAAITLLSRVLGMVRTVAISSLGAKRFTDAFWTAFRIPNLFRRLFGEGALSASFVPVFTEIAESDGWDKARLVLANTAGLLALVLGVLVVVIELGVLAWLALAPPAWDRLLLGQLVMIVLPFMFTVCLLALGSAALNCKGHFAYPAFAPILLNVALIVAAYLAHSEFGAGDWRGLFALGISVVVAGVVQLVGVYWLLRRAGLACAVHLWPMLPEVRRVVRLALPMMLPLGLLQFSALFDYLWAWWMTQTPESPQLAILGLTIEKPLREGVVTCLNAAGHLYQLPLGTLAISLATVVFPLLSRYAARRDAAGLRNTTNQALRLSLFLGIPSGAGLIILAGPISALIYEHGEFKPENTATTARILQMYCLGMWAYFAQHILLRAFFSQKDTRTPLRIACALVIVNIILVVVLVFTRLREAGIGLATACTSSANVVLLTWALRRRWGRIGARRLLASALRTIGATLCMAGAVMATRWALTPLAQRLATARGISYLDDAIITAACVPVGIAVFFLVARLARCAEPGELGISLRRKRVNDSQP